MARSLILLTSTLLDLKYTSCSGDIYLVKTGEVNYFDGQDVQLIDDLPIFSQASNIDGFNYLLHRDQLYKYDCDMRTKLHEWTLPILINSFNQIDIGVDDNIYLHEINSDSYVIYNIDSLSQVTSNYGGTVDENERVDGIRVISDSIHLVYGEHQFELNSQTFYRKVNTNYQSDYPTVDVQLSDFVIEYFDVGVEFDYFSGDSVRIQRSKSELTINNLGSDSIYALDIFSNLYRSFYTPFIPEEFIRAKIDSTLPPFESRKADRFFIDGTTIEELEDLRVELTGANYRFLENGSQVLLPNLFLSSIQSTEIETFKIYPNPTEAFIVISSNQEDRIMIFSSDGSLYSRENFSVTDSRVDVSTLNPGLYYVVLQNDNRPTRIGKFVKM